MFNVGDEVLYFGQPFLKQSVIVRAVYGSIIAIEFLQYRAGLHDCHGDVYSGNGWYVKDSVLEKLPTDSNNI